MQNTATPNEKTLNILHLSDLHREPGNPISNKVLLSTLMRDRDNYTSNEDPRIPAPNFVIVSGDIVQGVKHDTADAKVLLKRQYDEATTFLNTVADEFVDGDKDRVVIVPGNHDVSDEVFRRSTKRREVHPDARRALVGQLFRPNSKFRWSWEEFALYEIDDPTVYDERLTAFCEFYEAFYEGKRHYGKESTRQLDFFDYPDYGIAVVGFSSCYNNDLLNRQGAIHPDCIAEADTWLRDISLSREPIRVAVWHHNTEGSPTASDYMDSEILQNLIDIGFSLGFHGHQHRPAFLDIKFRHVQERRMTVISAGTLCGGAAFRHGRAYNIIEIDPTARSGRLHLREMQNDKLDMPIFGPRSLPPNRTSFIDFTFDSPPQPFARLDRTTMLLNNAQTLYNTGEFQAAADILAPLAINDADPLARRLLLECYKQLHDVSAVVDNFDPPEGPAETIALMDALWELGLRPRLAEVLKLPVVCGATDSSVIEMRNKYAVKVRI
ncbi:MAG: metallophosphoesterase [Candidatus Hydrogenedentes bacterium]|nr:metallophosphoesterase [Candidatus Hydrogenedentota bacterium]